MAVFLVNDIFQRYDTNILSGKKNVKTSKTKSGKKCAMILRNDFDEVPVMKSQRSKFLLAMCILDVVSHLALKPHFCDIAASGYVT